MSLAAQVNAFGEDEDSFVETQKMLTNLREKQPLLEDFFLESERLVFTGTNDSSKKQQIESNSRDRLISIMQSDAFKCGSDLVATPSYASVSRFDSHSKATVGRYEKSSNSRADHSNSDRSKKMLPQSGLHTGPQVNQFIASLIQVEQGNPSTLGNNRSQSSSSQSSTADGKGVCHTTSDARFVSPYPTPKSEPDSREVDKTQQSDHSHSNPLQKNPNQKSDVYLRESHYYLQNSAKRYPSKDVNKFDVVLHSECTHPSKSPNLTDLSDSIQEKEVRISFKMDPDSRQSPISTPIHEQQKLKSRQNALPGVRPISFTREGLEKLEKKTKLIAQQVQHKLTNDPLTKFRQRSVGKKLKEAMMRYNTRAGLVQPFRKKPTSNHIAAENSSKKSSRQPSPANITLTRIKRNAIDSNQRKTSSIAETLNAIMNRQRSASASSRDSSRSKICTTSIVKSIIQPMDKVLNASAANSEKASVDSRRKNLLHHSGKKPPQRPLTDHPPQPRQDDSDHQKADASRHLQKSASNSTNRLFNRIFRRDIELTGKSLEASHVKAAEKRPTDKSSKRTLSHREASGQNELAEKSRIVGLDSLIQKMYQAGNSKVLSEHYLDAARDPGVRSDRNFESHSDLFRSELSTLGPRSHRGPREDNILSHRKLSNPLFQKEPQSSRETRATAIQEKSAASRHRLRKDPSSAPPEDPLAADQTHELHNHKHSSLLADKPLHPDLVRNSHSRRDHQQPPLCDARLKQTLDLKSLASSSTRPHLKSTRTSPLPRTLCSEALLHSASNTNYLPQQPKPPKPLATAPNKALDGLVSVQQSSKQRSSRWQQ